MVNPKKTALILADNWQWLLLWLGVVLSALYSRPPLPVDETRYLSVAWDMWQNNQFLVPHINGVPYSQKPPLFFWFIHLFWAVFGVGEWQARLVGPLFGLISLGLTVRLARILWPEERDVAVISPFVLLGMCVWALFSSLTMFDTLLTCCCLLALKSLLMAERHKTAWSWCGVSFAIGMGLLAKGPVVLLYVAPPMLLAPLWSERSGRFWRWWYGLATASIVVGIMIALCWAIPAAVQGGAQYGQDILFGQTSGRIVRSFAHRQPFYWYILLLPLCFFPWILWRPVWRGWEAFFGDRSSRFCLSVVVPALVLLSCVSGKQLHYALPLLPVFALILTKMAVGRAKRIDMLDLLLVAVPLVILGVMLFVVPLFFTLGELDGVREFLPWWLGAIPLLSTLPLLWSRTSSLTRSTKIVSASYLLFCIFLHLSLAVPLHGKFQPEGFGEDLRAIQERSLPIAVFPAKLSQQFQFAGQLITPLLGKKTWGQLVLWAYENPGGYCLFYTKDPVRRLLVERNFSRQYKDGWLVFCPAQEFNAGYQRRLVSRQTN